VLDIKNYREKKRAVPIKESYEPMVEIPKEFLRFTPHPYQKLGAPYGKKSPFYLRKSVVILLEKAQKRLQREKRGYRVKIFDAFRPIDVQRFMMEYDKERVSIERYEVSFTHLLKTQQSEVKNVVSHFWSPIERDVALSPPPHSTGGALDLTLVDESGVMLDMGSEIDELTEASRADFFHGTRTEYEKNRELLKDVMTNVGFTQLPTEWWHFSYGDQIWAVDKAKERAIYGVVDISNIN